VSWVAETIATTYTHSTTGEIPPSLMFFHIPTQEWIPEGTGVTSMYGDYGEDPCWSGKDSDILNDLLDAVGNAWVMSVGHDHVNNYCLETSDTVQPSTADRNVSLCYGGKTSEKSYNDGTSGGRIFNLYLGEDGTLSYIETFIARQDVSEYYSTEDYWVTLEAGSAMILGALTVEGSYYRFLRGTREWLVVVILVAIVCACALRGAYCKRKAVVDEDVSTPTVTSPGNTSFDGIAVSTAAETV
ncbi:hypothetical protein KIPB_001431, partial [Kipferlia bialata]